MLASGGEEWQDPLTLPVIKNLWIKKIYKKS